MATFFEYWTISLASLATTLVPYGAGVKRTEHYLIISRLIDSLNANGVKRRQSDELPQMSI